MGTPAACTNVKLFGFGTAAVASTATYSAKARSARAYTASPGLSVVTPSPSESTTPATS
jgi:hypothetical protein